MAKPIIFCTGCQKEQPHCARGLCVACYQRLHQRPCAICGRSRTIHGRGACRSCYSSLEEQEGFATPPVNDQRWSRAQQHTFRSGLAIDNLTLSADEQELERCRRAEIYRRHIEQHGRILWGQVAPEDVASTDHITVRATPVPVTTDSALED